MNDIPRLLPWIGGPADGLGGVSASGLGPEGIYCAMEELSQRTFTGLRL